MKWRQRRSHTLSLVTHQSENNARDIKTDGVGRPFVAGNSRAADRAMRQLVAEQLLAAMSGPDADEQAWARELFTSQGFLDETISTLRSADAADARAAAARTLGITGSSVATAHLVAGLFDRVPEVCQAAAEALARIDDPAIAIDPLKLLKSFSSDNPERNRVTVEEDSEIPAEVVANLESSIPERRIEALDKLAWSRAAGAFQLITRSFIDTSAEVRNAAAHALFELDPAGAAESFSRAIEQGTPDQRRNVGAALNSSGLAQRAIDDLVGKSRPAAYNALCLLSVMAKTGEFQPLIQAIEEHKSVEVRCAAARLLELNGQSELAADAARRRLKVQG